MKDGQGKALWVLRKSIFKSLLEKNSRKGAKERQVRKAFVRCLFFNLQKSQIIQKLQGNKKLSNKYFAPTNHLFATRAGKMWWSKVPQRAQPEHGFVEPEPPD